MSASSRVALVLIFLSLWGIYLLIGQMLDLRYLFLTTEGAVISARAILAVDGNPASLANLPLTHPPLPFAFSIPFAALGLPHPSIWVSSLFAAILCTWVLVHFRHQVAREPWLGLLMVTIPLQPGLVHGATTGNSGISAISFLAFSTYLIGRFILEQQAMMSLRRQGLTSAWMNKDVFQADRMRFLWSSAMLLALAGMGRFDLILALPLFLLAAPFLLPEGERTDVPRILTVALVFLLPLIAVHLMWAYLSWVFTGDAFYGLKNPATYFQQVNPAAFFVDRENPVVRPTGWEIIQRMFEGILWTCPVLFYVLLRLHNLAVVLICLAPFAVFGVADKIWLTPPSRELFVLAYLQTCVLLFIGASLHRFWRVELILLIFGMLASTALSWSYFSNSPLKEERVWKAIAGGGMQEFQTFRDERDILGRLGELPPTGRVLLDEGPGFAFITLSGRARPFLLSYESDFSLHAQNPHLHAAGLLMRPEDGAWPVRDQVGLKWSYLDSSRKRLFETHTLTPSWVLLVPKKAP